MAQRIALGFFIILLALTGFTAYRNVFTAHPAVQAKAEALARETAACRDCKATRTEIKRGVLSESYGFTMQNDARVLVTCRRSYIAFGDYACTATKQ